MTITNQETPNRKERVKIPVTGVHSQIFLLITIVFSFVVSFSSIYYFKIGGGMLFPLRFQVLPGTYLSNPNNRKYMNTYVL